MGEVQNVELFEAAKPSAAQPEHLDKVRSMFEGFSRSEFAVIVPLMAPGAEFWVLGLTPHVLGAEAENPNLVTETFTNGMRFTIRTVTASGNSVAVEWEDEATTATKKHYRNDGISVFQFNDEGKITSIREYIDPRNFLNALG